MAELVVHQDVEILFWLDLVMVVKFFLKKKSWSTFYMGLPYKGYKFHWAREGPNRECAVAHGTIVAYLEASVQRANPPVPKATWQIAFHLDVIQASYMWDVTGVALPFLESQNSKPRTSCGWRPIHPVLLATYSRNVRHFLFVSVEDAIQKALIPTGKNRQEIVAAGWAGKFPFVDYLRFPPFRYALPLFWCVEHTKSWYSIKQPPPFAPPLSGGWLPSPLALLVVNIVLLIYLGRARENTSNNAEWADLHSNPRFTQTAMYLWSAGISYLALPWTLERPRLGPKHRTGKYHAIEYPLWRYRSRFSQWLSNIRSS